MNVVSCHVLCTTTCLCPDMNFVAICVFPVFPSILGVCMEPPICGLSPAMLSCTAVSLPLLLSQGGNHKAVNC